MTVGILPIGTVLTEERTGDRWIISGHFAGPAQETLGEGLRFVRVAYTLERDGKASSVRLAATEDQKRP